MSDRARNQRQVGPYSRVLNRGAIGDYIDGRSTIGRFCRDLEKQLIKHCGGSPSITQKLLIDRVVRATVQLDTLDKKMMSGDGWTDHDSRTHGGLLNRQRLLLRELGRDAAEKRGPSIAEHNLAIAALGDDAEDEAAA